MTIQDSNSYVYDIINNSIESLKIAKKTKNKEFKSPHWDIFPDEFEDIVNSRDSYYNFRSNDLTKMLDDKRSKSKTTEAFLDLSREVGIDFIESFFEAKVGNPSVVKLGKVYCNYNDLYMIQFAYKIINHVEFSPKIICDIGGGYGSLAAKLKKYWEKSTLVLLDLPEVNVLQMYYITQLYPEANILTLKGLQNIFLDNMNEETITYELLKQYDFVILPGWMLKRFEDGIIDIVINTRSMMEMHSTIVDYYINNIQKKIKTKGVFYCANRYVKSSVGYPIKLTDYPFDKYWKVLKSSVSWRQPQIHELILVKENKESSTSVKEEIIMFLVNATLTMNALDINRTFTHDKDNASNIKSKTKYLIKITFRRISRNLLNILPNYLRYLVYKAWN